MQQAKISIAVTSTTDWELQLVTFFFIQVFESVVSF